MPSTFKYFIILLVFFIHISSEGNAQRRRRTTLWDGFRVTPRIGVNMFYGDLVDKSRTSYSAGVVADKELTEYLSARVQLMGGSMKGQQIQPETELEYAHFKNTYIEFGVGTSFRPLDLAYGYFKQRSFSPYILGQVGIIYYNTSEYYGPAGHVPNTLRHTLNGITPQVTGGLGLSYYINSQWSINAEYSGTLPFSDLLDGHKEWVSGVPPNEIIHQTESLDFYYTASLGVSYLINDARWKNAPKYNRKAYLKTRGQYKASSKNRKAIKRKQRRR